MSGLIASNIVDPSLREWILPCFTTTTKVDQAVVSILMMATLQEYFSYKLHLLCGLPSVTLLGQKNDWEALLAKVDRLSTFGHEPKMWVGLLKPVLERFVNTFDNPEGEKTKDFWQHIAHYSGGGSGPTYLSGWITAFCFWGPKGRCFHRPGHNPGPKSEMDGGMGSPTPVLQLDATRYHRIETSDVPNAWTSVPVTLDDNGVISYCIMGAGLVGFSAKKRGEAGDTPNQPANDRRENAPGILSQNENSPRVSDTNTIAPESGWWICEQKGEEQLKAEKEAAQQSYY